MDAYVIKLGDMYLHSSTEYLSPLWTLDVEQALWMTEDKAKSVVQALTILEDLTTLTIEQL
jgi:hypothetical protein